MDTNTPTTILLVDDDIVASTAQKRAIERHGFVVRLAQTAEDALSAVTDAAIDLILMDINLGPESDGADVAQTILKNHDIPVIYLSGHTEPYFVKRAEKTPTFGYLLKSSGATVIVAGIKMALDLHSSIKREREANAALIASENRYRALFDNTTNGLVVFENDADPRVVDVNTAACGLVGKTVENLRGQRVFEIFTGVSQDEFLESWKRVLGTGSLSGEFEFTRPDGTTAVIDQRVFANVIPGLHFAILNDVTAHKRAEEDLVVANKSLQTTVSDRDVLLKEVNHRVKNNLMVVDSLLSLHESEKSIDLSAIRKQIATIATVHGYLYRGQSADSVQVQPFLEVILESVFGSGSAIDVQSSVENVSLAADLAVPLGLIVNEIATNAAKHAFQDGEGTFCVDLVRDQETGMCVLKLANSGPIITETIDAENHGSLGLHLVDALVSQLQGELRIEREPETTFVVSFPCPQ